MASGVTRARSNRWNAALAGFVVGAAAAALVFTVFLSSGPPLPSADLLLAPAHAAAPETAPSANPRESICYIYGVYSVARPYMDRRVKTEFSGTGFLVAPGLIATNGHIAEPWRDDAGPRAAARSGRPLTGEHPRLEKIVAFFPGIEAPVELAPGRVAPDADVAVLGFALTPTTRHLAPLALGDLAAAPGDEVTVIGYPLGLMGMLAKAPRPVTQRLMREPDDLIVARELARLALIRPSSTTGHLGDVVEDTLVFDASTAHGGSGGPVLNREGKVIGITSAYLRGFAGGSLGVSVRALRPLLH